MLKCTISCNPFNEILKRSFIYPLFWFLYNENHVIKEKWKAQLTKEFGVT